MKRATQPTSVNLKELSDDGEEFVFSRQSGELNATLTDLINGHPYSASLYLQPLGNVYEISGEIDTKMNVVCSHCGRELLTPIHDNFKELIIIMSETPRAGHSGHTGLQHDEGPVCNYSTGYEFDLAEFVHEHIALAEPSQPFCQRPDCDEVFQAASRRLNATASSHSEGLAEHPFAVLKQLKVKKSH